MDFSYILHWKIEYIFTDWLHIYFYNYKKIVLNKQDERILLKMIKYSVIILLVIVVVQLPNTQQARRRLIGFKSQSLAAYGRDNQVTPGGICLVNVINNY